MARRKKQPTLTIVYRKLGREKARGQYCEATATIELDERLKGEEHLEVLVHESMHALQPHHGINSRAGCQKPRHHSLGRGLPAGVKIGQQGQQRTTSP
jgi:hypothetical protein